MAFNTQWFLDEADPNGQPPIQSLSDAPKALFADSKIMHRPAFAHVEVNLQDGEEIVADGGSLMWMDGAFLLFFFLHFFLSHLSSTSPSTPLPLTLTSTLSLSHYYYAGDMPLETACHSGGCCDAYWRSCAGESCCQNKYTGPGNVAFGFDLPGDILPFYVTPEQGWMMSSGAFIAGSSNLTVSGKFPGCSVCCCGGEGMFITEISVEEGAGMFYAGDYGAIQRHDVPAGKTLCVDSGLFFATSANTKIDVGMAAGCKTCCLGGEGFVMKITGPAFVYTQNRDPAVFLALLNPPQPAGGKGKDEKEQVDAAM